MNLLTYQDALNHAMDFLGGAGDRDRRDSLAAVQGAYREITNMRRWNFFVGQIRISTVASYNTGTVVYDHTGGANERMLTLTTGTWPTWTAYGTIVIANTQYQVERRVSNSIITLTEASNPGEDVASSTYSLYQGIYPLPEDFVSLGSISSQGSHASVPQEVSPEDWIFPLYRNQQVGTPCFYAIIGDPNLLDSMAIAFAPPPSAVIHYDGIYVRRPRRLQTPEYKTGTVSVTSGAATITGTSTVFTSAMAGAVIRLSGNATQYPTDITRANPANQEFVIQSYTSGTALTADSNFTASLTNVKYTISDPVDLETNTMMPAFLRCIEMNLARMRRMRDLKSITDSFYQARIIAQESDSRSSAPKSARAGGNYRRVGIRDLSIQGDLSS